MQGSIVPVVDLRCHLGLECGQPGARAATIVIVVNGNVVAGLPPARRVQRLAL